jgi:small subunit ribosomal protein S1
MSTTTATESGSGESFAALLEESLQQTDSFEGTVVKGKVVGVDNDQVLIDVGLKSEGRVPLREFSRATRSKSSSTAWKTRTARPC